MTPATALLERFRAHGVSASLRADGKLWLEPKKALTPELLAAAKAHRDALVALLAHQSAGASAPPPAATATADPAPLAPAGRAGMAERLARLLATQDLETDRRWQAGAPKREGAPPAEAATPAPTPSASPPPGAAPAMPPATSEPPPDPPAIETGSPHTGPSAGDAIADPTAIAARAAELLAEAKANRAIAITDAARAREYFRARTLQEWAAAGNRNPMRPPRFQAPARWWSDSRPAWCTGCIAVATWRADPPPAPKATVLSWCCVRCGQGDTSPADAAVPPRLLRGLRGGVGSTCPLGHDSRHAERSAPAEREG
jgi:hypothetical protein